MKLEFSRQVFEKNTQISKFLQTPYSEGRVFLRERADKRTDMTKLTVALQNFANAPKIVYSVRDPDPHRTK
jgi:hypothetical protein